MVHWQAYFQLLPCLAGGRDLSQGGHHIHGCVRGEVEHERDGAGWTGGVSGPGFDGGVYAGPFSVCAKRE